MQQYCRCPYGMDSFAFPVYQAPATLLGALAFSACRVGGARGIWRVSARRRSEGTDTNPRIIVTTLIDAAAIIGIV